MERPDLREDEPSVSEVAESLESAEVVELGRQADRKRRRLFDDRVYYGGLKQSDEVSGEGYTEVGLEHLEEVGFEEVDAFVGDVDDGVGRHDTAWSAGASTDYAVGYGDRDAEEVAEEMLRLREVEADIRCVEMVPLGRTTAYRDLAAAATARQLFDDVHVRLDRAKVGDKLAQTSLEFGVDDVGFVDGVDDVRDVELLADELGFTAVERGGDGCW